MSYTRGRPTVYKGIKMRSRLEASFASALDSLNGVTWTYEPQCFADATGQYLPDFLVDHRDGDLDYMEVKPPTADTGEALRKMHVIRSSEPSANLYVVVPTGIYPNQRWTIAGKCDDTRRCAHCSNTEFIDERIIPSTNRAVIGGRPRGGYPKCSQAETDAFLADRPFP